jgi:hypothetical protein
MIVTPVANWPIAPRSRSASTPAAAGRPEPGSAARPDVVAKVVEAMTEGLADQLN